MTTQYDADVIVVGSGVSGSLIANRLARAGKSVILLEAGPRVERWSLVERFLGLTNKANVNGPYPDLPHARDSFGTDYIIEKGKTVARASYVRLVGGTTWHWAGASWRLLPNDFKTKTLYGIGRDWPIGYDDLEPYYGQAERELGVSGNDQEDQGAGGRNHAFPPRTTPYPMPPTPLDHMHERVKQVLSADGYKVLSEPAARNSEVYDDRPACAGNNNCTPICPIGALYSGAVHAEKAEAAGARLIPDAVVYKIETGDGGKISAVVYKSPDGTDHRLTARYFVLAAYAIETPKLMLMSTSDRFPQGIANSSGMVGRNLTCQPESKISLIAEEPLWPGRGPVHPQVFFRERDGDFRKLRAAGKHVINNNVPNQQIAARLLKEGVIGPQLDEQIRHQSARFVEVTTQHELPPNPENRIVPSTTERDALGLPRPEIHFSREDPYLLAGAEATKREYQRITQLFGGRPYEDLRWSHPHSQGTTIMGADPRDSVVDGQCRAHDHPNLFIAGPNVMSMPGVVNPTLTAAALALRSADVILREV
ncbi:MAG: family oxidoreductase [Tardiphaga sp.]|jgi:choline dehydrogenase-like flavoprotein|uniref:GMC family oxidoreductase n=1 Tax=Tardiphaga sp. TaxID=1926292 RepID=UPI00260E1176|nr:GMC family oxidoreductase [Tardiphaga sp.]MDB5504778.1 family oxidoreductase [Tardiphaga sp.]